MERMCGFNFRTRQLQCCGSLHHLLRFCDNHLTIILTIKRQAIVSQLVESTLCGKSLNVLKSLHRGVARGRSRQRAGPWEGGVDS